MLKTLPKRFLKISETFSSKDVDVENFVKTISKKIFRGCCGLASVQEEDKWGRERGAAREKS